jgi:hypothetical protein
MSGRSRHLEPLLDFHLQALHGRVDLVEGQPVSRHNEAVMILLWSPSRADTASPTTSMRAL